jgi:hypothetical protein
MRGGKVYHIGMAQHIIARGRGVIGSDASVQAVVKMWDDNLLILGVDRKIARAVKKGDYVIVDYTPLSDVSANRKLRLIKVLPVETGSSIWAEFRDEFEKRKARPQPAAPPQQLRYIR